MEKISGKKKRIMVEIPTILYSDLEGIKPANMFKAAFYSLLFMIGLNEYCKSMKKRGKKNED